MPVHLSVDIFPFLMSVTLCHKYLLILCRWGYMVIKQLNEKGVSVNLILSQQYFSIDNILFFLFIQHAYQSIKGNFSFIKENKNGFMFDGSALSL